MPTSCHLRCPAARGKSITESGQPARLARVFTVLPTDSSLADAQWMLTCRWVKDTTPVHSVLHCGDDGVGRRVEPAGHHPHPTPALPLSA